MMMMMQPYGRAKEEEERKREREMEERSEVIKYAEPKKKGLMPALRRYANRFRIVSTPLAVPESPPKVARRPLGENHPWRIRGLRRRGVRHLDRQAKDV